ncbi:MAG: diaminopimelate dehydrogenase [Candidatus Bathyarchaeota archaeon]
MRTEKINEKIRIGIVGYGNIGKGIELAIEQNPDMVLKGIFTRRNPNNVRSCSSAKILHISDLEKYRDIIDVAILCGGSAMDLPEQGPKISAMFNTIDSYDTHAKIPKYFEAVDKAARKNRKTSIISTGWDPGLFSLLRVIAESALPKGKSYTFWGPGVSQGHSNAIRGVHGVKKAIQYTFPIEKALIKVRNGKNPTFTSREMHRRICYVVPEKDAELEKIQQEITTMPNYFEPYDTEVNFISEQEMIEKHSEMPHGGFVLRSGITGTNHKQLIEFSLKLDSNAEFTANIMIAYARAGYKLNHEGNYGAKTVFDVPPGYLSMKSTKKLITELL